MLDREQPHHVHGEEPGKEEHYAYCSDINVAFAYPAISDDRWGKEEHGDHCALQTHLDEFTCDKVAVE